MSVLTAKPTFLYPHSRQFPFDEVAEKIVRALEKRNWNVPGISVDFYTYGTGEAKYKMVFNIIGNDFLLHFCRSQGKLSNSRSDIAALDRVCIPKEILQVYSDESGPTYYLYAGNNWECDKDWFMNSIKVHSKLNKKPRRYLKYKGNTYQRRATDLISDNDLNREYSPEAGEPVSINLRQKFEEFTAWLEEFVLNYILSLPEADTPLPDPEVELIPYQGPWSTVFSVCNWSTAERLEKGKKNPMDLAPEDRHAYIGDGHRLVPLSAGFDGQFPEVANDGFIWCDTNQSITANSMADDIVYDVRSSCSSFFSHKYIVAINLKYSNNVYVADNSKFDEKRKQLFEAIAPRDCLTDEELNSAYVARGATLVPITEYKGGYKEPIVLIDRELDFDEIEWVVEMKK